MESYKCFRSSHGKMGFVVLVWSVLLTLVAATMDAEFTFNGFRGANLILDGSAAIMPDGLLRFTSAKEFEVGHAFYPHPLRFRGSPDGSTFSFSSNFVYAAISVSPELSGHGIVFVLSPSPSRNLIGSSARHLGLFNRSNNGDPSNHVAAVELDMFQNEEFGDIDSNHVGIDINGLRSIESSPAGFFTAGPGSRFVNLSLSSGDPLQIWVEYDGAEKLLNVTLSPMGMAKPSVPLLSSTVDLSKVIMETMYVGFSSSTGKITTAHVILGWSFKMNGTVQPFNFSTAPSLPSGGSRDERSTLVIFLSTALPAAVLAMAAGVAFMVMRRMRFSELLEDWEQDYGPHRFSYKDLFRATKGFGERELLGAGGFGKVYRGVLPTSMIEVAIKKISHESRQGMREFIAEIVSIGQVRHRSLVQLLGYCRRKGELLLVYDFMPNGSLDKFLFGQGRPALDWNLRHRIIKDVASGLLYLHEEWEQVVVHRDIKASNILLDSEFNARVGDFGLARLYDHKTGPRTTHVAGTMGYIAPELTRTSRATTATDVFAFGAFMLEVACGRRPIERQREEEEMILVNWVLENWNKGEILLSVDPRLRSQYVVEEAELVLILGLCCSHPSPTARPSMRRVVQVLSGDAALPALSSDDLIASFQQLQQCEGFDDHIVLYPSSIATDWILSGGR